MNDNQLVFNFLCRLNDTNFRQERKTPLLFVEGVSDIKFFYPLLEAAKFEYDGRIITLKIAEANIVSDFIKNVSKITEVSLINLINKYNMKVLNMNLSPNLLKLMKIIVQDLIK